MLGISCQWGLSREIGWSGEAGPGSPQSELRYAGCHTESTRKPEFRGKQNWGMAASAFSALCRKMAVRDSAVASAVDGHGA